MEEQIEDDEAADADVSFVLTDFNVRVLSDLRLPRDITLEKLLQYQNVKLVLTQVTRTQEAKINGKQAAAFIRSTNNHPDMFGIGDDGKLLDEPDTP